jgi:hypothetical protein
MSGLKELLKNPGICGMMVGHHNGGISPELLPAFRLGLFLAWGQGFRIFALVRHPTTFIDNVALYPIGSVSHCLSHDRLVSSGPSSKSNYPCLLLIDHWAKGGTYHYPNAFPPSYINSHHLFFLIMAAAVMLLFRETQKSYQANHEKVYFYNLLYNVPQHSIFHLSIYVS